MSDEVVFRYNRRDHVYNLSRLNRLELRLIGHSYLGKIKTRHGELAIYAFKCPDHGVVANYPHGHARRLLCPVCLDSMKKAKSKKPTTNESG